MVEGGSAPHASSSPEPSRSPWALPELSRPKYPALAGLRGVAAAAVVSAHVGSLTEILVQPGALAEWLTPAGPIAVVMFFAMSGMLILGPLLKAHQAGRPRPSAPRFIFQRMLRVYPNYWFILVAAVFVFDVDRFTASEWPRMLTLLYLADIDMFPRGLFVAWTLAVEMAFYLVAPFLIMAMYRLAGPDRSPEARRRAQGLVLCVAPAVLASIVVVLWVWRNGFDDIATALAVALPMPMAAILSGCICGFALNGPGMPSVWGDLARRPWLCVLLAFAVYWLVTLVRIPLGLIGEPLARDAVWFTVLSVALCVLLALPASIDPSGRSLYHRILGHTSMRWLGELSYSIYLWHMPVLGIVERVVDVQGRTWAYLPTFVVTLAGATAMAVITYVLVEQPARRLSRRLVGSTAVVRSTA